jgi:hypothetical protein
LLQGFHHLKWLFRWPVQFCTPSTVNPHCW